MSNLASNTRRSEPLPRFIVYDNGYAFALSDRLIPDDDEDAAPRYEHGKRGIIVALYPTRAVALAEAQRLNAQHPTR
jgi:hypothetical protein